MPKEKISAGGAVPFTGSVERETAEQVEQLRGDRSRSIVLRAALKQWIRSQLRKKRV